MEFVLVTGGAGYIGSHTAKALKKAGYTPVVYDNLVSGSKRSLLFGPFEEGDILDSKRLDAVFKKYPFKAVFHFASRLSVPESILMPSEYYMTNVIGSLQLMDKAKHYNVPHFVYSSSAAVYGIPESFPLTEESRKEPITPYGRTKLMVEQMLSDFDKAYAMTSVSLRYFNAVGSDPELEIGLFEEARMPHLLPKALQALKTGKPVKVFGRDYPTKDGTCIRDYIHVSDLADAHVRALSYLEKGGRTTQINLGTGEGYSVLEVLDMLSQISGKAIPVVDDIRRAGDPPILIASPTDMFTVLQFRPKYSRLETIVKTAYDFSRQI